MLQGLTSSDIHAPETLPQKMAFAEACGDDRLETAYGVADQHQPAVFL